MQPLLTSAAKSEADTTLGAREFAWSFGDVVRFNGKGEKQIGKAGHLGQTLPFIEGNEHRFPAAIAGDDGRLAGHSTINQVGVPRL